MALTIEGPSDGDCRWSVTVSEQRQQLEWRSALSDWLLAHSEEPVQLWLRQVDDASDRFAKELDFVPYRDLWQLRCALPAGSSGLDTRAFTEGDTDAVVTLNNRAFHWHPEQSGLTAEAMHKTMTEPWFDADGFRLFYNPRGRLAGFCWTKIHADPDLGEIYVIAVDPDFHGQGLGKPMTVAGLEWLATKGLNVGMLYVESDNHAANAVYAGIGFSHHHTDRAYRLMH